jgi:dolichol kinase
MLLAFLVIGFALGLYENADISVLLFGTLIFNGLASTYRSKANYAFFALAIIFVASIYGLTQLIAQSMLLGFLSASHFFAKRVERASVKVERRRDEAQVLLGLVIVCAFDLIPSLYIVELLIGAILLASLVGNFSLNNKSNYVSRMLHSFERSDAVLGQGAMWLATGTLFAISFLQGNLLVAVLVPLFVGDAVATLAGTAYPSPLPYNKKKSVSGAFAYFAASALISFPFVGYIGVATALVGAVVESLPMHIDDNFDTAAVLTLLIKVLDFAGIV